ncbi:metallophosphoesterase [Bradyrhizobium sp. BR 10261]|uniref:metallophosphoesterase n=1 Tax=Bradyrhizobium sp. BR 10261 TaxID=2749992 RepID=UPI001C6540FD|nr:metallophosphoesterase [Bradyrhizobium sp. BR 10261]MBW7964889.1 metallophosphoesterase [Bradyrhizobium sp. BR 10261]
MVFVSDLHFGVGRRQDGDWDPTEDFRWPNALQGFVDKISELGHEQTDLVIVGDFLELWQPPASIACKGDGADLGCTITEMAELSKLVAAQHGTELRILRGFAERGENRLHLIVGNHDSTLRYQDVWETIGASLNSSSGRIELVTSGLWTSSDGRILAEHGHQIGEDVNRYESWPNITRRTNHDDVVIRPWGELFVQRLFNSQEAVYPVIDNLSPETAGARIRAADRGFWRSGYDIARLLVFNLFETSVSQKAASLGAPPAGKIIWNVEIARGMRGSLLIYALNRTDPMRLELEKGGPEAEAVKKEMDNAVQRLSDEEIRRICDLVAEREPDHKCWDSTLGAVKQNLLDSKADVMGKHLALRKMADKAMQVFIYGHTHQFEEPWIVTLKGSAEVTVVNTGAFQRLINERAFMARLHDRSPAEGLRTMDLAELAPCYNAVIVADSSSPSLAPQLKSWLMPEDKAGMFVSAEDPRCSN